MSINEAPEPLDGFSKSILIRAANDFLDKLSFQLNRSHIPPAGNGYVMVALTMAGPSDSECEAELLSVVENGSSGEDVAAAIFKGSAKAKTLDKRIIGFVGFGQLSTKKQKADQNIHVNAMIVIDPESSDTVLRSSKIAPVNSDGRLCGSFEFANTDQPCPVLATLVQMIFAPDVGAESLANLAFGINSGFAIGEFTVPDGTKKESRKSPAPSKAWAGKVRFSDN